MMSKGLNGRTRMIDEIRIASRYILSSLIAIAHFSLDLFPSTSLLYGMSYVLHAIGFIINKNEDDDHILFFKQKAGIINGH